MKKLNKRVLYWLLGLVISWVITHGCFAFVLMDFNSFNWTEGTRMGFLLVLAFIIALSLRIVELFK